jgi:cytoskeletal protein CcmA (bactofilin family)
MEVRNMSVEKKTIRSDIPGSHVFLNGNVGYVGSAADGGTRRLVVTRDISLNGDISACNYLVIEGVVHADSFSARRMDILDGGLFCGNAKVRDCVIAGRFEGKLSVMGRLTVKPTGQICGDVEYGVLEIESGGKVEGQMNSLAEAEETVAMPVLAVLPPIPVQNPIPAQNNIEPLFSSEEEEGQSVTGRASAYRRATRV